MLISAPDYTSTCPHDSWSSDTLQMSAKDQALHKIRHASTKGHRDVEDHQVDIKVAFKTRLGIDDVGRQLTPAQKDLIVRRLGLGGLVSLDDIPLTATFMIEKIEKLSLGPALDILRQAVLDHENDVNMPVQQCEWYERLVESTPESYDEDATEEAISTEKMGEMLGSDETDVRDELEALDDNYTPYKLVDWQLQVRLEAALIVYHSPYIEVRAVTHPFDDATIPVETFRAYVIGIVWTCILAFMNEFFNDRLPSIALDTNVVSIFTYLCGRAWERIVPDYTFKVWKYNIALNHGPWSFKEQMLVSFMFIGGSGNYVSANITVQKLDMFYGNPWVTNGYQVLLILSSNFMGFGFAGILRRFVIYPSKSVWPSQLPVLALNRALLTPEKKELINGWGISRYHFFFLVFTLSFFYYWLPDFLFQALSYFNWMTWIKPDNFNLAMITGSISGLGLNPIPTFDWSVVGNQALSTPFYSTANVYVGSLIGLVAIAGVYWTNYKWTAYLPINSNILFNNKGEPYDVREILTDNTMFDEKKYEEYGPPFYTAANLVVYGAFFALYPLGVVNELISTYKATWEAFQQLYHLAFNWEMGISNFDRFDDPHSTMMKKYKEVPDWFFYIILVLSVVFAILAIKLYPTNTPVWGIFFALGINFLFLIPITTLVATTGQSFTLNVLVELIMGYALPGNGLGLMIIKALGTQIDSQAQSYIGNQKLGHYAKVPPRAMFRFQILGLFVGGFVSMAALNFKLNNFENYCELHQPDRFSCPGSTTFFSSSVVWGVIGPRRVFHGLYPILRWCFLIGLVLAVPSTLIKLYATNRYFKFFQPSLVVIGIVQTFSPLNLTYVTGQFYVSLASMWYLRKRYSTFWSKYNYLFTSAMEASISFSGIIIFFAVQYHPKNLSWWGNNISYSGIDGGNGRQTLLNATSVDGGYFGPRKGNYP